MENIFCNLLLLAISFKITLSCMTGGTDDTNGVLQRIVGKDVTSTDYDAFDFDDDHVVQSKEELQCDFSSSCCWQNSNDNADLSWKTGTGIPEVVKIKRNFNTETLSREEFLVAYSDAAVDAGQQARFQSCLIQCTTGSVTVSARHWATKGVSIKVCKQEKDDDSLKNCKSLSTTNPGPHSVSLPSIITPSRLVIVASGFTATTGSVAIIDDLKIKYDACTIDQTTTTISFPDNSQTCDRVQCNFETNNFCSYSNQAGTGEVNKQWQVVAGQFQNLLTGIRSAGEGNSYMAVYLKRSDAAMLSTNVNINQERVIRFLVYNAVDGVDLQACCDNVQNCVYKLGANVQVSYFKAWKTASISCPAGTKQVIFYAKNYRTNEGAVGLDNIQLLSPNGGSLDSATQTVC